MSLKIKRIEEEAQPKKAKKVGYDITNVGNRVLAAPTPQAR